jgi:hypothetical protein
MMIATRDDQCDENDPDAGTHSSASAVWLTTLLVMDGNSRRLALLLPIE